MKKFLAILAVLCLLCCTAFAEEANYVINMDAIPEGYTLEQESYNGELYYTFTSEKEDMPVYYGSVAFSEIFDGYTLSVENLTDEEKAQVEELFSGDLNAPEFDFSRKTTHGTDLIILCETGAESGTVEIVTIWQGYFITIGVYTEGEVTAEMIDTAITILSDLWVVSK
ncbi:MAG: hypothetical protein MJ136_01835 [Clostridia bacterium]|nr:hypothetical protein [Clostridia bacterium]